MTNRLNKITTEEDIEIFEQKIGFWKFESQECELDKVVSKAQQAVHMLQAEALFTSSLRYKIGDQVLNNTESAFEYVRQLAKESCEHISIMVDGPSMVYLVKSQYPGPRKRVEVNDIIRLELDLFKKEGSWFISLNVSTNSTIWLPFNSKGLPQIDVYAINLGRLSHSLVSIEEKVGMTFDNSIKYNTSGKYCIVSGYFMTNYADPDSEYGVADSTKL